jgi:replicative DNA helicase
MANEEARPMTDCDIESEQHVLGCILANFHRYYEVRGWIMPGHFADPIHAKIYELIAAEIESAGEIYHLQIPDDVLEEVGGQPYLDQLRAVYSRPPLGAAGRAGQAIHQCWSRREGRQDGS